MFTSATAFGEPLSTYLRPKPGSLRGVAAHWRSVEARLAEAEQA